MEDNSVMEATNQGTTRKRAAEGHRCAGVGHESVAGGS